MKRSKVILAVFSTLLVFLWVLPEAMRAQDMNQAALVVRHSDQSVQTACVDFSETEISGLELLQRSGFDLELEVQGLGAAVCRIGQSGCPANDCWCQCKGGGECTYWSYWQQFSNQWQYSQGGASIYAVSDGDIQGWSWGPGAANSAYPPPNLSFDDVCRSSAVESDTATPPATPIVFVPADTPAGQAAQNQPTATITFTPLPTSTNPATATKSLAATAVPTNPPLATAIATAIPISTAQPLREQVEPDPTITPGAPVTDLLSVVDQDLHQAATATPSPSPSPSRQSDNGTQPQAETAIALAAVGDPMPTRPGDQDNKKRADISADRASNLTVVGSEALVPNFRVLPVRPEEEVADRQDINSPASTFSYMVFGAIVLVLGGWLAISSIRRGTKLATFDD